ncbi:MAG: hypothetical protein ACKV2U_32965, partial [Bryobacteraceae bacterium]
MWINGAIDVLMRLIGIVACLWGWGFLASRVIWRGRIASLCAADTVPFGLAAMYVFGVAASLIWPLSGSVDWIAILIGWAGAGVSVYENRRNLHSPRLLAFLCVLAVLLAFGAVVTPVNFDAGLYQMQVMKYVQTEPVPLGIANIQDRLGFNSSMIVIGALLEGSLLGGDGSFLLSAAIFWCFVVACLERSIRSWSGSAGPFTGLFAAFLLCLWLGNLNGLIFEWFSHGPNGDIPGAIFCCWTFVAFFALVEDAQDDSAGAAFMLLACCCVVGVSIKLSQAPVALLLPIAWRSHLPQAAREALRALRGPILP